MKSSHRTAPCAPSSPGDRRAGDRRSRIWWSVVYGNFNPRRRRPQRRANDFRYHSLDWHAAHLLALSIGILLLSAADAFMTVTLLSRGAIEVNPVMALVVYKSAALFAGLKMGMTSVGVLTMVILARYRFMRVLRVELVMFAIFIGYLVLLGYETWMLRAMLDIREL
jgi:hypothetical protein